jgi:hypothetical protein
VVIVKLLGNSKLFLSLSFSTVATAVADLPLNETNYGNSKGVVFVDIVKSIQERKEMVEWMNG